MRQYKRKLYHGIILFSRKPDHREKVFQGTGRYMILFTHPYKCMVMSICKMGLRLKVQREREITKDAVGPETDLI
ncbi:hypothetical protein COPEUT_01936 [Coprococcus eutactus ATCC 27759]|nr:hypothetical protein COPEUT_01936 [Coprococcus eutactus ATCC 27759]